MSHGHVMEGCGEKWAVCCGVRFDISSFLMDAPLDFSLTFHPPSL